MIWFKRSDQEPEIKDDLSEEYLAWNGRRIAIIRHGYVDADGKNVWVIEDGVTFDFTHWSFMPDPPGSQYRGPE